MRSNFMNIFFRLCIYIVFIGYSISLSGQQLEVSGKIIDILKLSQSTSFETHRLDSSTWPSGMLYLRLKVGDEIVTHPFVKL